MKPIQIITSPQSRPPFQVDAWVYEQDTALLLCAADEIKYPSESAEQLIEQAVEMSPLIPGSVLVRGYCPLELLAIVHDLDQEPSWREEWILKALHGIMQASANLNSPRFANHVSPSIVPSIYSVTKKARSCLTGSTYP
ncbi:conserved hypothetical protein [Beggiatoa sp. SS]|nr:conserved hypothetical protein [Beggiatoa sp. SS]